MSREGTDGENLPMRIAVNFMRVDPSRGGAETYVADLCHRLSRLGHAVDLVADSWRRETLPPEVRTIRVAARGRTRLGRIWGFGVASERYLRAHEADHDATIGFINTWHHDVLIPQGGVHAASRAANARRFPSGIPRAAYLLGKRANPKSWFYGAIEAKQYAPTRGTRVIAVSEMVRSHLERYHGVPRDRVRVIPNAIDADRLSVADPGAVRRDFRRSLGLGPDDLVALFVGHNYHLKGLKPLLLALRQRRNRDPQARPIHLLACGGGKPASFRKLVADLGLDRTVHLLGFQDDIRPCFHAADFFALPTYYDPCSLVVFEALACGLPVITTAQNGAGELIRPGQEGFVVSQPDALDDLADALDRMAIDDHRHAMAARATVLGREQSFDRHVARLIEVFAEVAEAKGRRITDRSAA